MPGVVQRRSKVRPLARVLPSGQGAVEGRAPRAGVASLGGGALRLGGGAARGVHDPDRAAVGSSHLVSLLHPWAVVAVATATHWVVSFRVVLGAAIPPACRAVRGGSGGRLGRSGDPLTVPRPWGRVNLQTTRCSGRCVRLNARCGGLAGLARFHVQRPVRPRSGRGSSTVGEGLVHELCGGSSTGFPRVDTYEQAFSSVRDSAAHLASNAHRVSAGRACALDSASCASPGARTSAESAPRSCRVLTQVSVHDAR